MMTVNPVFLAVDTPDVAAGLALATRVAPHIGGIKLGLEFYLAHGADGFNRFRALGLDLFLDLKLHDIPNTVAGAVSSVAALAPTYLTIHASGGPAMIAAAKTAAPKGTEIIAVSVLTSLSASDLSAVGQDRDVAAQVVRLGRMAVDAGADGLVCSPLEVALLRDALGDAPTLIVPGIRPAGPAGDDQKRTMTPADALAAGATKLVIGRPITQAGDPAAAAQSIAGTL